MVGFVLGINSCCTKKDCLGFNDISEIQLQNFALTDVDSITLETFMSSSNFTNRIDSTFTSANKRSGDSNLIIFMPQHINESHDYKIKIMNTGLTYLITDIETRTETCNSCFPYQSSSDYYNVLDAYSVNGQMQNNSALVIAK